MPADNERLEAAIQVLLAEVPEAGRTRLIKLLYLADLAASKKDGRSITGIPYRWYHYGPYNRQIIRTAEELVEAGVLQSTQRDLSEGREYHGYRLAERTSTDVLSPASVETLKEVVREHGSQPLDDLLEHVYGTEPMQDSVPGGRLRLG